MIPASNQKVLTAAAAAERLGWDYRFTTRVLATGSVIEGTLDGNLVIIGNGDPTINPRHPDRWRAFDDWAAAIRAKGICTSQETSSGTTTRSPSLAGAWDGRGTTCRWVTGPPSVHCSTTKTRSRWWSVPAMTAGARAILTTSPFGSGIFVENSVTTAPAGSETQIDVQRDRPAPPFSTFADRSPSAPSRSRCWRRWKTQPGCTSTPFARRSVGTASIVGGHMVDVDELPEPPAFDEATELVADQSPPLGEIIDVAMKWSRNGYAETLLYAPISAWRAGDGGPGPHGAARDTDRLGCSSGVVPAAGRVRVCHAMTF